LGQLAGTGLNLLEQPDVASGNHCLVGERCHQLDLPVGKGLDLGAEEHEHTDGYAIAQQRNANQAAVPTEPLRVASRILRISERVGYVNRNAVERSTTGHRAPVQVRGMARDIFGVFRVGVVGGNDLELAVLQSIHECILGMTQPARTLNDRVEDGLHLRRRAGDDRQHLARGCLIFEGLF
jgi:hypothetical protein